MAGVVSFLSGKGGQGKTTLATLYALFSGSEFVTNDYRTGTKSIYSPLFPNQKFHTIEDDIRTIAIGDGAKVVFDFGGYLDSKIPPVIAKSDLCIIPLMYQSRIDHQSFDVVFNWVRTINKNIIIVINNTDNKHASILQNQLPSLYKTLVFKVNKSSYMHYLADSGKTPFELDSMASGITKKHLLELQNQLISLFKAIAEY